MRSCSIAEHLRRRTHAERNLCHHVATEIVSDETPLSRYSTRHSIAEHLRLSPFVQRADIVGMGCHAGINGLEAARTIRRRFPNTRVVTITIDPIEQYVKEALEAGVSGFVLKSRDPDELLQAIRLVHAGERYLSPAVERLVVEHEGEDVTTISEKLTRREREVCQLLASGRTVPQIAELIREDAADVVLLVPT